MPHERPTDTDRLAELLHARHAAILITTDEECHALEVVKAVLHKERRGLMAWDAVRGLRDETTLMPQPAVKDTENPAAALYHLARIIDSETACVLQDPIAHFDDPRTLRAFRELARRTREVGGVVILIDHRDDPPPIIAAECTRFDLSLPDEAEIEAIVRRTLRGLNQQVDLDVRITKRQLRTIVRNLSGLSRRHCEQVIADVVAVDRVLDEQDINHVLARKRQVMHQDGVLEYVEAPVDLSEIGGLEHLKHWLKAREGAFDDKAGEFGLRPPRGVLMLGVQGAGKSLCSKAIATAWQRPLLRLDPSSLYDRYVGESEKRLREALRQAEMMAPIVLWIDEIEKGFASAASTSNDGGLSRRMFGTLLTWMQEHEAPVFMVATANDIEALPPELLRKGRFDEIFFVDLPAPDTRKIIFEIHLRKRGRDPAMFDLDALADASDGYSGAEIEQAILSALHEAYAEKSPVTTAMVVHALENSPPLSVTMAEKIAALRRWAEGRCVPAG